MSTEKIPAVVFGESSCNSLGVLRAMGRRGIPVTLLVGPHTWLVKYSRYGNKVPAPDLFGPEDEVVSFLLDLRKQFTCRPVLLLTSDRAALVTLRHRKELEQSYRLAIASLDVVEKLVDKGLFYRTMQDLGVSIPATVFPEDTDDLAGAVENLRYPLVIKPTDSQTFHAEFGVKAMMAHTRDELLQFNQRCIERRQKVIVQEMIPGNRIYMVYTYFNGNSEEVATCGYKKLRQYPPDFGSGTFVETAWESEAIEAVWRVLHKIGFHGIAEPEFKWDPRDNCYKLIEINARTSTQNRLPAYCGCDMEYLAYREACGLDNTPPPRPADGTFWLLLNSDLRAWWDKGGYRDRGDWPFGQYLRSLFRTDIEAIFALDDWRPFMSYCLDLAGAVGRTILRKLGLLAYPKKEQEGFGS